MNNLLSKLSCLLLTTLVCIACTCKCTAQVGSRAVNDTVQGPRGAEQAEEASNAAAPSVDDSTAFATRPHPYQPNPKKSGLYSAIIPGLGQAYNHQYWKVPVVYAGLGVAAYFIVNNLTQYQSYRLAYISRLNNPNYVDKYTLPNQNPATLEANLQQNENDASKFLNLTVLFTGIGYFLQVVDAITSAHLKNFDISRDISMHVTPVPFPNGLGMGLVMNFK